MPQSRVSRHNGTAANWDPGNVPAPTLARIPGAGSRSNGARPTPTLSGPAAPSSSPSPVASRARDGRQGVPEALPFISPRSQPRRGRSEPVRLGRHGCHGDQQPLPAGARHLLSFPRSRILRLRWDLRPGACKAAGMARGKRATGSTERDFPAQAFLPRHILTHPG